MTSPMPLDYNDSTCSYCGKDGHKYSDKFRIGNQILWACSLRCKNKLIDMMGNLGNKNKIKLMFTKDKQEVTK